jgi:hypothetical protein
LISRPYRANRIGKTESSLGTIMQILALGHRQQTGKDTLAGFIATRVRLTSRKLNVQVAGFADELKDTCFRLYSWAGIQRKEHYERFPADKEVFLPALGKTVRQVWIEVGNHMRQYDVNVWVRALLTRPLVDVMIVKDLRFPHEVGLVRQAGGAVIKVTRASAPEIDDDADVGLKGFEDWDLIVDNDGTKEELNQKADLIVSSFKLGV